MKNVPNPTTDSQGAGPDLQKIREAVAWRAREKKGFCPSHQDINRSLSVDPGHTRPVVVYCHAGCSPNDVITALVRRGLWPSTRRKVKKIAFEMYSLSGKHQATKVRHVPPDGRKYFTWHGPDGSVGLPEGLHAHDFLYGAEKLKPLPDSDIVIICEGPHCAKAINDLDMAGVWATATVTGAGVPEPLSTRIAQALKRFRVYLWPDNDAPGREHMRRIGTRLQGVGAAEVRIIDWKQAPHEGDVVNLLEAGGTVEDIQRLIADAALFKPQARAKKLEEAKAWLTELFADGKPRPAMEVLCYADSDADIMERTLKKAKAELGIEAKKMGYQGEWHWLPPKGANSDSQRVQTQTPGKPQRVQVSQTRNPKGANKSLRMLKGNNADPVSRLDPPEFLGDPPEGVSAEGEALSPSDSKNGDDLAPFEQRQCRECGAVIKAYPADPDKGLKGATLCATCGAEQSPLVAQALKMGAKLL